MIKKKRKGKKEAHDRKELTAASSLFYFLVMLRWFLLSLPSFSRARENEMEEEETG